MAPFTYLSMVSLNGVLQPRSSVCIRPDDRAFRFGDGVFETLPVIGGQPYLWEAHLARLHEGLHILGIEASTDHVRGDLDLILARDEVKDAVARILISRGEGSAGYLPTHQSAPLVLLEVSYTTPAIARLPEVPVPLRLCVSPWRRIPPACLPAQTKLMQGVNPTLSRLHAARCGFDEALSLSVEGYIAEASSANVFWEDAHGTLHTPALATGALAGTMRARLMQILAPEMSVREVCAPLEALENARALILTNALGAAMPASSLTLEDGRIYAFERSEALAARCNERIHADTMR